MTTTSERKGATLVDGLLRLARDGDHPVSIYLVNGFQLKGEVVGFDAESILFAHKGVHQVVMRSGVATMYPLSASKRDSNDWWQELVQSEAGG